jgi:hypothetical protein
VSGLLGEQRQDGGWAAVAGGPATTESTGFALLALWGTRASVAPGRSAEMDAAIRRAVTWLGAHQRPDGSWPATELVAEPSWMTSVALLALAAAAPAESAAVVARGSSWLVGERVFRFDWQTRLSMAWLRLRGEEPVSEADESLVGWPWVEGTYSWVEPTCLALLALRREKVASPTRERVDRMRLAERLLGDRMVPGGGWNYGNTRVFGQDLAPYPDTTAWALLALRAAPADAAIQRVTRAGLDRLPALLEGNHSALARSLGALALRAHGRDDRTLRDEIAARVGGGALPPDTRSRALALLALAGPPTPFES